MSTNNKEGLAAGGLLPDDFYEFLRVSAIMGMIAALVLVSALIYKAVEKYYGPEQAKKFRWVILVVDIVILFIFGFIYMVSFNTSGFDWR